MKKKFKIIGVEYSPVRQPELFPIGFKLKDVVGDVCPLVDGNFVGEPEFETLKEKREWYEEQVGKTLMCDDLSYKAFATIGKTYIV